MESDRVGYLLADPQQPAGGEHRHARDAAHPMSRVPLVYLADWLPPDFGAVGQYAMLACCAAAKSGREVCLIGLTSSVSSTARETFGTGGSLEIRRISAARYDKSNQIRRLLWSARTNWRLVREGRRKLGGRGGEVLFTGSPPFMLFFAVWTKWLFGVRLVYRITDFYPEVIIADRGTKSMALTLLARITWSLRRQVDSFEVLGEDQRRLLEAGGIAPERITLRRDHSPVQISGREAAAARPVELSGHKVLLYSGNYGVAHEVETVIEGLIRHRQDGGQLALWLNATGSKVEEIEQRLRSANVPVARTAPVSLDRLPALLAAADIHLIALRPQFSGIVLPSKVYGCIASRRPIIFVGPEGSDVHLLCSDGATSYARVEPGDVVGMAASLGRLANAIKRPSGNCADDAASS